MLRAHAWLYPFENAREMIGISKFHGNYCHYRHHTNQFASLIEYLETKSSCSFDIAYIPSIRSHIKKRGFDHAKILAKLVSEITGKRFVSALCPLHNESQVGKSREERIHNPKFSYKKYVGHSNFLLIDDVATTRSTLFHGAEALKRGGANQIIGLTLSFQTGKEKILGT